MSSAVDQAVEQAAVAAAGLAAPARRAALVRALASGVEARAADVLDTASGETALTLDELRPELARLVGTLRLFAELAASDTWPRREHSPREPDPARSIGPGHELRSELVPLGLVAAVLGASNFPLAYGVLGGDTASALAAGLAVVVKEHPAHPATGRLFAEIARRAAESSGLAPGCVGYVRAEDPRDHSIAEQIVGHAGVAAVGFTGSRAGGLALERWARERERPIPVFAEMGSVNPVFVSPRAADARGPAIAEELAGSITARHGQQCTRPGLVFLDLAHAGSRMVADELASRLRAATPRDMLAPWIAAQYRERCLAVASASGVETLADPAGASGSRRTGAGLFRADRSALEMDRTLREEIFGPAAVVIGARWSAWPHDMDGCLVASVYAEAHDAGTPELDAVKAVLHARAGRVCWNGVPTGVRVAPGMVHAGPFPSTNRADTTAVGPSAIGRWCRPVCIQGTPV
jgi:2,5-dioxopentanoate dehydrogenase